MAETKIEVLTVDLIDQKLAEKLRYRRARGATGPLYGLRNEVDELLEQRHRLFTATHRALTTTAANQ